MLKVGEVRVGKDTKAEFRIRESKKILNTIIPIFDKYPLLTSKYYNYVLFKQGLLIYTNPTIPMAKRNIILLNLKKQVRPSNYISPV
jgi:LAGLIDADG endonuclease